MTYTTKPKGRIRVPLSDSYSRDDLEILASGFELPPAYPPALEEFVQVYRMSDKLPGTDYEKLVAKPAGDTFRMFPSKYRRAINFASPEAKLVFWALWDQHEARHCRANGLLAGSIEWLQDRTGLGSRNAVSDAVLELEVRGIIRVKRGRGGRSRALPNLFLLAGFPDCLGNPPVCDYEKNGLPADKPRSNSDEAREAEAKQIAAHFNARIEREMVVARFVRRRRS